MSVYLVRHAAALDASMWRGPDEMRPLTGAGHEQARGVAASLEDTPVDRIVSSPSARCLQTVAPLAKDRGLDVEHAEELEAGADDPGGVIDFLLSAADEEVVHCSHDDVVSAVLERLADDGVDFEGDVGSETGSTLVLEVEDGAFTEARYLPPMQVELPTEEDEERPGSASQPGAPAGGQPGSRGGSGGTWSS